MRLRMSLKLEFSIASSSDYYNDDIKMIQLSLSCSILMKYVSMIVRGFNIPHEMQCYTTWQIKSYDCI